MRAKFFYETVTLDPSTWTPPLGCPLDFVYPAYPVATSLSVTSSGSVVSDSTVGIRLPVHQSGTIYKTPLTSFHPLVQWTF